ncbi:hypothetical protein SUGI_0527880 [Cryptomeria japonica]|nr:hypothetical protein SUGI_0527880 [Cryptomeria japonica]
MEGGEEHRSIVMNRGKTRRKPPKIKWPNALLLVIMAMVFNWCSCMTVLSKSKLTKCERTSDADLSCQQKLILNIAVPSGSRGDADSVDVLLEKAEDTLTGKVRVFDEPPKIRVSKSPAFALYALHYLKDVNSEPKEIIVETRKCEEDSDKTVGTCKRLRDKNGKPIDITQPKCCPCGSKSRWPYHKCGSRMGIIERIKGKRNTAHCLRFVGSWFHVFEVGRRQIGFNVKIEVSQGDEKLIIINVNPQNKRAVSNDNFLKANLIGDFSGYRSVPSFDNMYLSIPAQNLGKPKKLGNDFMKWMLIERTRYTLDGTECDKIGVDFVGFSNQPSFCSAPLGTCIQQQLINYLQFDTARVDRNQIPEYLVGRRFSRINQHPGAGPNSFSIGILEPLNSRIILEIKADDIRFTVNKSPGKITAIFIPHFEALSQFGNASIFTINTGELEASYSLHFSCQEGVNPMLDQQYSMKPTEVVACMFEVIINKANTSTFNCTAILKNSGFEEVDRQDTWFTIDNVAYNTGNQEEAKEDDDDGNIFLLWEKATIPLQRTARVSSLVVIGVGNREVANPTSFYGDIWDGDFDPMNDWIEEEDELLMDILWEISSPQKIDKHQMELVAFIQEVSEVKVQYKVVLEGCGVVAASPPVVLVPSLRVSEELSEMELVAIISSLDFVGMVESIVYSPLVSVLALPPRVFVD